MHEKIKLTLNGIVAGFLVSVQKRSGRLLILGNLVGRVEAVKNLPGIFFWKRLLM